MFILLSLIALCYAEQCVHDEFELCTSNNCRVTWDFVLLVTTWPGEFCKTKCCDMPTRLGQMTDGFTMHGWWPSFSSGSMPACCKYATSRAEVQKVIESDPALLDDIAFYWPSLSRCHFIEYEYDKHGVCLTDVYTGENGAKDYVNAAIKLIKQADAWNVFKSAGAVADGKTKISKKVLLNALAKKIGVENAAYFRCSSNSVSELRYCTTVLVSDKANPMFQRCTDKVLRKDNCGDEITFAPQLQLTPTGCDY
ncbi:ribonuclease, putative [Entamoeba histolytica HM-1:IMSS-B]|uniref:Ribonuclease, putative n=6 Tax=Entamoeba histolytica TaxID=5759 RepID=C4LWY9_ENTH1|nr:ribonuclease, putative [Entamoeba histolytica HM-1:IMSS]EMD45408.1 ribonuclease, putative [Entamoeba histolytica KU27]EMH73077.1 ribonuclease, putative [Entamoeba histolytica HM-1:IMSS-B]EMS11598.1 ribonuclease [Entamoeba histolytica HM-3:IMSS]ENY64740.1 ribonuclease, putative [Entamoeba histolytica HM-1:IMSS-A]GAT93238.1 ribonuclease putative [Entamoeba histolytica]|eukprot:XP_652178.1 ribonuclease, putative [Entamoeba histolytica HM-1:IMSS]